MNYKGIIITATHLDASAKAKMENVINAIKCCICKNILKSPINLPCGHSICQAHASDDLTTVYCYYCLKSFENVGFVANKVLDEIITINFCLFQNYDKAMMSSKRLQAKLEESNSLHREKYISGTINEFKLRIDFKVEELIMQLYKKADKLKNEFDDYEKECKNYLGLSEYHEQSMELISVDVSNKLKSLNVITINEEKIASIHNQCEEAIAKMEALINYNKKMFLLNRFETYQAKAEEFEKINLNTFIVDEEDSLFVFKANNMEEKNELSKDDLDLYLLPPTSGLKTAGEIKGIL